ncbi:hypothetical protein [Serratia sp. Se-RSBMAAmG]|uniref:hypothetical protein n=1 Tax=Serratia sp. Se-RSBMAAmG TaxID=3043305 RepID=UPI0024AFBF88|nr:hypothetical protein [Serratia sp. Se-RSBMAAmG]MDI6976662.1 hypothetical protein [Serratia sp. Se-RSBMAAmG]
MLLEQENGSIKLSSKEYKRAKKSIIEDHNYLMKNCLFVAEKCYAHIQENIHEYQRRAKNAILSSSLAFDDSGNLVQLKPDEDTTQKGNKFMSIIVGELVKNAMYYTQGDGQFHSRDYKVDIKEDGANLVKASLLKTSKDGVMSIQKPQPAFFPLLKDSDTQLNFKYGSITFNDEKKTITWDIPEGDNSVKQAWQSRTGLALTNALNNVEEWKESTGGIFSYKNSNSEDFRMSKNLGPIGQEEMQNRIKNMRSKMKAK